LTSCDILFAQVNKSHERLIGIFLSMKIEAERATRQKGEGVLSRSLPVKI